MAGGWKTCCSKFLGVWRRAEDVFGKAISSDAGEDADGAVAKGMLFALLRGNKSKI